MDDEGSATPITRASVGATSIDSTGHAAALQDIPAPEEMVGRVERLIRKYLRMGEDLRQALGDADFSKGVFVVDASGVHFSRGFECESEVKS